MVDNAMEVARYIQAAMCAQRMTRRLGNQIGWMVLGGCHRGVGQSDRLDGVMGMP